MAGVSNTAVVDPMSLVVALARPESLMALGAFAACLVLAWLMVWGVRRVFSGHELAILLGHKLIDGVLFPVLLLGLTFVARIVLTQQQTAPMFAVLLPVCISLVVIRLGVKVLQVAFATAPWVRVPTSEPAPSSATTTASSNIRPRSGRALSSARIRLWSPRSKSAMAPTLAPGA